MALDRVNNRMFIPEPGNIRILVYQLDEKGFHVRPTAENVVGHDDLLGRRRLSEVNAQDVGTGPSLAYDNVNHRLFAGDSSFGGPPGSRILVFDMHPSRMKDHPAATLVLGQPDFTTRTPGAGRKKFGSAGSLVIDEASQRLFVADGPNNRILVFDITPGRVQTYADAAAVIGQSTFESSERGVGRNRLAGIAGMALDARDQRLFVSDSGNNRILVFDVNPARFRSNPDAIFVLGQPDFQSRTRRLVGATARVETREGFTRITPGGLGYDPVNKNLFVMQRLENRILVFEAAPERMRNDPEAIAVLGQPDFETFEPRVAQDRFAFPKDPVVDPEKQMLYVSEGFPGGNRVIAFDISPGKLRTGSAAVDVVGHIDDFGQLDYTRRMANDRLDERTTTLARAVALDSVDHRLWVADEYNNRVLGFQLDSMNRLLDRKAKWVFGQKDFYTAQAARSVTGMNVPLAVAYDSVDKRLYVGDGWNDRVMIYDVAPSGLRPGGNQPAIAVLGQADFESQDPRATRNRFDFAVDQGRGIASDILPLGIALDERNRRAFVSDGGNNRVLAFDIRRDQLKNGADATAVLGQRDYTSAESGLSATAMSSPGHLAYDPENDRLFVVDSLNHRVLTFEAAPGRLQNGMPATRVLGQPDFTTTTPAAETRRYATVPTPRNITFPNGVAYDSKNNRLIVTDRGNDRFMVFEAAPEKLTNNPEAIAVLGQRNDESHANQQLLNLSAQDQVNDPRGIAYDSENQQLFGTDSHWARLLVYNFPSTSKEVSTPGQGVRTFSSLDAWTGYEKWAPSSGYARVAGPASGDAVFMLTRSRFEMDPVTEQQSRILVSQAAARAPAPATNVTLFVDSRNGFSTMVFAANPGTAPVSVQFTLRAAGAAPRTSSRSLAAGSQLTATVGELIGGLVATGTLRIESTAPIAVTAWLEGKNRAGEDLLTMTPIAYGAAASSGRIVPDVAAGGGYQTEVILLNPGGATLRGALTLRDINGKEIRNGAYSLEPYGVFLWPVNSSGQIPQMGYIDVRPEGGGAPVASALVSRSDGGLITMTRVDASAQHRLAIIPVQTFPDPIRHGRGTRLRVTIAAPGPKAAEIRFALLDQEGSSVDRFNQVLPPGLQRDFTISDLFNRSHFAGSLRISSDVPIAISAVMATTNIRGEEIIAELPVAGQREGGSVVFPYLDGEGRSTQMFLLSTDGNPASSRIDFFKPNGDRQEVILR